MSLSTLTHERLRAALRYDPATGIFTNVITRHWSARSGDSAGSATNTGYIEIGLDGARYLAHRLAWFWMTGRWPQQVIDHIDGNGLNNKWDNLRDVAQRVNSQNMRQATAKSSTGLLGAYRVGRRFKASLRIGGKVVHVGHFATAEQAHKAYVAAKRESHAGCTI